MYVNKWTIWTLFARENNLSDINLFECIYYKWKAALSETTSRSLQCLIFHSDGSDTCFPHRLDLLHRHTHIRTKYSCSTRIPHSSVYPLNFTLNVSRQSQSCRMQSLSVMGSSLISLIANADYYSSHWGNNIYVNISRQLYLLLFIDWLLLFPLWGCALLFATFSCFAWALQRRNEC